MRKLILLTAGLLLVVAGPALAQDKKTLAIVVKGLDNPFFEQVNLGCQKWQSENALNSGASDINRVAALYVRYAKAGGDSRSESALHSEGLQKIGALRERGLDIAGDESASQARVDRIYEHARRALFARLEEAVITDACGAHHPRADRSGDPDHSPAPRFFANQASRRGSGSLGCRCPGRGGAPSLRDPAPQGVHRRACPGRSAPGRRRPGPAPAGARQSSLERL